MWKRLLCFFAATTLAISAQSVSQAPDFTGQEIAIYRDFLLHYPSQLSNMIGMQDTTVAFVASAPSYGQQPPPHLKAPPYSGRKLPSAVMALTSESAVTARITAEGMLMDPHKRGPAQGPDGFVRTNLTLSEIAFDPQKKHAAFLFSAPCGCKGGQGGMVIYERKNGHWTLKTILDAWQG